MDPIPWKTARVIDAHAHFYGLEPVAHFNEVMRVTNFTKANLMAIPGPHGAAMNGWVRERKAEQPDQRFAFGCMDHDPARVDAGDGAYLAAQIQDLLARGFDGLKMLEGKPSLRRGVMPLDLDHAYWEPYWAAAEERDLPVTCHVADPIDFWQGEHGYQNDQPDQEHFHAQALKVLERHPKLRINFAHFFYLAPQLSRLDEIFSAYPGAMVDLAPGGEYLYYLSDAPEKARAFFIKWQARILYGTDVSDKNSLKLARAKAELPALFLEKDGPFVNPTAAAMGKAPQPYSNGRLEIVGLGLPRDVLENIYANNFERWVKRKR